MYLLNLFEKKEKKRKKLLKFGDFLKVPALSLLKNLKLNNDSSNSLLSKIAHERKCNTKFALLK